MCAQRRLKLASASAQFHQSLRCLHEKALHLWLSKHALSEDSDQTEEMRKLISI